MTKPWLLLKVSLLWSCITILVGCQSKKSKEPPPVVKKIMPTVLVSKAKQIGKGKLSDYGFFNGKLADLLPSENVFPYTLNTPLFTDYAFKKRFIFLPKGKKMTYHAEDVFGFEAGSILIKNFYYPKDFNKPDAEKRIIETRLLIKNEHEWEPLSYVWNDAQTDAYLELLGGETKVEWTDYEGAKRTVNYLIPNKNQCASCHMADKKVVTIGPTARQLNRSNIFEEKKGNQLAYYSEAGILTNLPHLDSIPKFPVWDQPETGTVEERSIAYLDINCAHCHSESGPAKNSGLYLNYSEKKPRKRGIYKPPVAAGRGSGDLEYSIVPGHPEKSILIHRMKSTALGTMMPEIGKTSVHQEAVDLLSDYISNLTVNTHPNSLSTDSPK